MKLFILILVLFVFSQAQNLPCGFTCGRIHYCSFCTVFKIRSRKTQYTENDLEISGCSARTTISAIIDGSAGVATCSDNNSLSRCSGCCKARALQEGLAANRASGFLSEQRRGCICCFSNNGRNCENVVVFGK